MLDFATHVENRTSRILWGPAVCRISSGEFGKSHRQDTIYLPEEDQHIAALTVRQTLRNQHSTGDMRLSADQKEESSGLGNNADPMRLNCWPKDWPGFQHDCSRFFECFQMHLEILRALTENVGPPRETLVLLYYPETTVESFDQQVRSTPNTALAP